MGEVFLSYSRQDEATARRVAGLLEKGGHSVWWDSQLPAHRAYSEVIEARLQSAAAVVVLWSQSAAKSQWVRAEADLARSQGKLVQASLDGSLPPMPFNQIQCADLKGWRGSVRHSGWAKIAASVEALAGGENRPAFAGTVKAGSSPGPSRLRLLVAGAGVLLLIVAAVLVFRFVGAKDEKPVVAVLPFESLDASDESLVAGIWEDTRQAIGRNPQLLVLGPNTAREIAASGTGSARKLADYLVEASVRSVGDRIRVSANLVRTKDGTEVWNKSFDRRLDDVFALQTAIASDIEGHVRGRLALKGGVQPENIVTSGEVYAVYSDARAKIRKRDTLRYEEARDQLRQVVAMDPNFAPGWATLSVAMRFYGPPPTNRHGVGFNPRLAESYARRAIALAPNLAAGHAALGFAFRKGPAARAALERAIALDPSDFESAHWLGNVYRGEGQWQKALEMYSRASEIEPLFWQAALARLHLLLDRGDKAAAQKEKERLRSLGNPVLLGLAEIEFAKDKGDLSEAAKVAIALLRSNPAESRGIVGYPLFELLLQLGHVGEARRVFPTPPFGPPLWNNDPRGLDIIEKMGVVPEQFFAMHPLPMAAGRVYVLSGRGSTLAGMYRKAVARPEDLIELTGSEGAFVMIAPYVALALRQSGDEAEASRLLLVAERTLAGMAFGRRSEKQALLARVHAAQGRPELALQEISRAVGAGWLPAPPQLFNDIAFDPAFASIKSDPGFERSRQHVLRHLAKERAELGPVKIG